MSKGPLELGSALHQSGDFQGAIPHLEEAFRQAPLDTSVLTLLGSTYCSLGDFGKGIPYVSRAVAIDPCFAQALTVLGGALIQVGQMQAAKGFLERAVNIAPGFSKACWNLAQCELMDRNYSRGFELYEWGRTLPKCRPNYFVHRPWQGEKIPSKTLLLWGEQGFGDVMQFLRFVPRASAASGAKIILLVQAALLDFAQQAFPDVVCLAMNPNQVVIHEWDMQAPLLSLPYLLGLTPTDAAPDYLSVEPDEAYKGKIGICIGGSPTHANNANRSLPEELLRNIKFDDRFVQIGSGMEDKSLPRLPQTTFYDTTRAVKAMAKVYTVDTALAHVCGAVGANCEVFAPLTGEWRWNQSGQSDWYPNLTVHRSNVEAGFEPYIKILEAA